MRSIIIFAGLITAATYYIREYFQQMTGYYTELYLKSEDGKEYFNKLEMFVNLYKMTWALQIALNIFWIYMAAVIIERVIE